MSFKTTETTAVSSFATSNAQAQALNVDQAAQQIMDTIQHAQESVVNAGHRPDVAVTCILRMEQQRDRINRAARSFVRCTEATDRRISEITQDLHDGRI